MKAALAAAAAAFASVAAGAAVQRSGTAPLLAAAVRDESPAPWIVGERLEYGVKWGFLSIGQARLEVLGIDTIRGEPCWHIQFLFSGHVPFYTLRDSLQSWFGVSDMVSRRFHQDNNENGRVHVRHYEIFPERQVWIKNGIDSGRTPDDPLDEASFFFYARSRPLAIGEAVVLNRYFQRDHNPVTIYVLQHQTINVPAGRFPSTAVRPVFQSGGLFGQGGKALVWFSDDESHIPLRIRTSLPLGTLDMSLRARN